ncbi:double-strand break repair helicase AddA [Corticibacterium sp. UT-5YL-CI-8]|nr:double-strand break repair helicase AddA [Tianweitania sp. UT-5YL-CI-8]
MKKTFVVPENTVKLQALASDPVHSVWVSANAGSGKTHVLSERVMRLLLRGVDPSKILCLTYTRAAAANMSNRVFARLSEWTMLSDEELAPKVQALDGRQPDAGTLRRARRLFAEALETPGGLKIQTIHAFCESVLHQFPLEANIAAHFEMLDPQMEAALFAAARRDMITGAAASDNPELAEAFAFVLERGGEAGLDALLAEILTKRDGLRPFIDAVGVDETPFAALFQEFGFSPGETADTIAATAWPVPGFDPGFFSAFVAAAEQTDAGNVLKCILPSGVPAFRETDPLKRLEGLAAAFLKSEGEAYSPGWLFKKALLARMPDLPERYLEAAEAIRTASDRLALFRMLEASRAALTLADWLIARYERLKTGRGFLDFNDLITRTVNLLARPDAGPWVQYKLDKGIDHILLDEAQDTSPDQWNVVRLIAEEFFVGAGARENVLRTIFAVGDEKQSIYSFQGAAPESFDQSRMAFSQRVKQAERSFEDVELTWSFRSTNDVLTAVDRVFEQPEVRRGVSRSPHPPIHRAVRAGDPGYVEVWPSVGEDKAEEPDDWSKPIDHVHGPAVRVAEHVAATVQRWLAEGDMIEGQNRRLQAGDVMVLVRKRDRFVHALSRELKRRDIPVSGADRLSLPGHIAVKDLIALGRFLLQPEDDLSLAALLRSPVFDLSEDALYALSYGRPAGRSLIQSMRRQAGSDARIGAVVEQLEDWANQAAFRPVFEFYSSVLAGGPDRPGVRRKMIARLGQEAGDILDEFLSFCLAEERTGLPGLEAFLSTLESAGPEIKREMDQTRNEVRIMTVHAAKGLEAPVVFLVDSGSEPFSTQHLPRLMAFKPEHGHWRGKGYLWRAGSDVANSFSRGAEAVAKDLADDEYRRLLYVGMTRAEDRLIVCGYHGKRDPKPTTWHSVVMRAIAASAETETRPHPAKPDVTVHRFRVTEQRIVAAQEADEPQARDAAPVVIPAELLQAPPPYEELPRPLSPSGASVLIEETAQPTVSGKSPVLDGSAPGFAIARGSALHKMLQVLPTMPLEAREDAAGRYLARVGADWPEVEREAASASVLGVLDDDAFAPIFAPGSRAEVAVMGMIDVRGKPRTVSGKIDRLAVTDDEVLIVDYKTNRPPPAALTEVPQAYIVQLALYRALLQPLYPGKPISAALLFTEAPRLIRVPAQELDAALARVTDA